MKINTSSPDQTMRLAERIGSRLKGGECIELVSDVGGGKTTFVKGLAKGAGSSNHVSSPTFTISKIYTTSKFEIVHFDFYRLNEPGLIEHEIQEVVSDRKSVIVVEWSEIVSHVLPKLRLRVDIKNNGDSDRQISFVYPPELSYLVPLID